MPMQRERYPEIWEQISTKAKETAAWYCQQCGMQCSRPGVHHIYYQPEDSRPENLIVLYSECRLRADAPYHHADTRKKKAAKA